MEERDNKGQFVKGHKPLENAGRPAGANDFVTDFNEAVEEIAKENGMTRSEARKLLLKVAFKQAKDGNYSFYKDIHDRIYGQPKNTNDVNVGGVLQVIIKRDGNQDDTIIQPAG